jgi:hypothetical protein
MCAVISFVTTSIGLLGGASPFEDARDQFLGSIHLFGISVQKRSLLKWSGSCRYLLFVEKFHLKAG